MTRRRFAAAVALVAAVTAAVTACTSSTGGSPSAAPVTSAPVPSTSSTPTSVPVSTPTSKAPTTPPHSPTKTHHPTHTKTPPPTTSAPPPPPTTSTPPRPPPSTTSAPSNSDACTADQLRASAIRGGAYQGREIAGIVFTNSSSTACTVRGYPFAQLRYNGKPLGKPAKDDPGAVRTVKLRPGKSAQSQLTAVTTCQAPISDHVRVIAPDTDSPKDVPMQLRGCSLSIDPLEAG